METKQLSEYTQLELDSMSIIELIRLVEKVELVTLEGYGGENKFGELPQYVQRRLNGECKVISHSTHSYNTWDEYELYTHAWLDKGKAIAKVRYTKTRGSSYMVMIVEIKTETIIHTYIK